MCLEYYRPASTLKTKCDLGYATNRRVIKLGLNNIVLLHGDMHHIFTLNTTDVNLIT